MRYSNNNNSLEQLTIELETITEIESYARNLLLFYKKDRNIVNKILIEIGLDDQAAFMLIKNIINTDIKIKNETANNDIVYGILWIVGGGLLTFADIGYFFWGAIFYGGFLIITGFTNTKPLIKDNLGKNILLNSSNTIESFSAIMVNHSDKELSLILTSKRDEYQDAAVQAAALELKKRQVNYKDHLPEEVLLQELEKEKIQNLIISTFGDSVKVTARNMQL
jgi:hypothetical protein